MKQNQTIILVSIILILLLPTSVSRIFFDMAGGLLMLSLFIILFIAGAGWLSWRNLKLNIKTCDNCGSQYLSDSDNCPACGYKQKINSSEFNSNIPASAATIDIDVEESK